MPFYLAWVYGKGQTFLEKLHTNSSPLHMVVLENTTLFFGTFRKGNVTPWEWCGWDTLPTITNPPDDTWPTHSWPPGRGDGFMFIRQTCQMSKIRFSSGIFYQTYSFSALQC